MKNPEEAFVRVKYRGIYFYSCYMPPSMCHEDFERTVDRIVEDTRNRSPVAIAGDFNACAVEWGSKETKKKGQTLLEAFSVLDLVLLNDGEKPIFIRGEARSMIYLTFVSSGLLKGNTCWRVSDILSDHCAIAWRVAKQGESENRSPEKNKFIGWKASAFDADAMRLCMEGGCAEGSSAKEKVKDVMRKVTSACDAAMPRRGNGNPHKPVYWWSDRIVQLRVKCLKARRLSQRARGKPTFSESEEKFKLARSKVTKAIKLSKRQLDRATRGS